MIYTECLMRLIRTENIEGLDSTPQFDQGWFVGRRNWYVNASMYRSSKAMNESMQKNQGEWISTESAVGQAEAARKNQQREARVGIQRALARLRIPQKEWPSFVLEPLGEEYSQPVSPAPFQAPIFKRLHQSPGEWRRLANADWEAHREKFLRGQEFRVEKGLDEAIPERKRERIRGKDVSGRKASLIVRYKWAAKRLCGLSWKDIAGVKNVDAVRRAASEVLRLAGWPSKLGVIKASLQP